MTKRVITSLVAFAMAFTTMAAAPARAGDSDDVIKFIIGAGALYALGSAISNNHNHGVHVHVHPHKRKVVPSHCMRVNHKNHGPKRYFLRACLKKNMRNFGALPGQCKTKIRVKNNHRTVFVAHCLRRHGWKFA